MSDLPPTTESARTAPVAELLADEIDRASLAKPIAPVRVPKEEWRIEICDNGRYAFSRYIHGKVNESYGAVDRDRASIYAASILQGFEPPRSLRRSDKPVD